MATNLIANIAREFISGDTDVVDIVAFCEAQWGLNIRLLPVQRFVLKCLYGMSLENSEKTIDVPDLTNEHILYRFTEKEFLKWLYEEDRCNTDQTEGKIFQEMIWVAGRRSTKSTLASCISDYELYKLVKRGDPSSYYGFPPNREIAILNVAPTDEQSDIVFGMTQLQAMQCPYLRDRSLHQTMTYFDIRTDTDLKQHGKPKASLVSVAGGCSSNSLRGRNAIVVIMDEMAFFIDNGGRFSGDEVYKALTPSIGSFKRDGKVLLLSSPYAKFGKFYERYLESFDEPDITLMFRMYTAMVNPTIPTEILQAARRRGRSAFMGEYGGEFSDSVTAYIDDESEFRKCVCVGKKAPGKGTGDNAYYVGLDLGFKNDGASIAIVHKDRSKIVLDYADVWFSASSDVWEFSNSIYKDCTKYANLELLRMADIVSEIKELAKWFPIKVGIFDQSNGYGLAELLHGAGYAQFEMKHFTDVLNSDVFKLFKRLYAEGLIDLFDYPMLIFELLTLEAEKKARDTILVRAPNRRGAHDDLSQAVARAVYICYNDYQGKSNNIATGAGGIYGNVSQVSTSFRRMPPAETQASFQLKRMQMHGDHPRGYYRARKPRAGAFSVSR